MSSLGAKHVNEVHTASLGMAHGFLDKGIFINIMLPLFLQMSSPSPFPHHSEKPKTHQKCEGYFLSEKKKVAVHITAQGAPTSAYTVLMKKYPIMNHLLRFSNIVYIFY